MTLAAKRHMGMVAELPCCVCGTMPVEVHHVLEGRTPGRKSADWTTIPVCPECHRGTHGIHGTRQAWKLAKQDELKALGETLEKLYGGWPAA